MFSPNIFFTTWYQYLLDDQTQNSKLHSIQVCPSESNGWIQIFCGQSSSPSNPLFQLFLYIWEGYRYVQKWVVMRPLAFKLYPWKFLKTWKFWEKSALFFNFAIWKKVFRNFIGLPQLNRDRERKLSFFVLDRTGQTGTYNLV